MIRIRVEGYRAFAKTLAQLDDVVRNSARRLGKSTVNNIASAVAKWNKANYTLGSRGGWQRVSVPAILFTRHVNSPKFSSGVTMGMIKTIPIMRTAGKRLWDTRRLFKSATQSTDPDFRISHRRNSITIGTSVPYADKHLQTTKGDYARTFEFGSLEKKRLIERVPRPDETRVAKIRKSRYNKWGKKAMSDRAFNEKMNNARPFYVLWNWAEKRYPVTSNIPKRTWIRAMPEEVKSSIVILVKLDLLMKMGKK